MEPSSFTQLYEVWTMVLGSSQLKADERLGKQLKDSPPRPYDSRTWSALHPTSTDMVPRRHVADLQEGALHHLWPHHQVLSLQTPKITGELTSGKLDQ